MLVGNDCKNNMLGHATEAKKGADSRFTWIPAIRNRSRDGAPSIHAEAILSTIEIELTKTNSNVF
jgi:hypothetical protein